MEDRWSQLEIDDIPPRPDWRMRTIGRNVFNRGVSFSWRTIKTDGASPAACELLLRAL